MKVLIKLAFLAIPIFILSSCSMLKESHNSAANAPTPLYAFFESAIPDALGCYPEPTTGTETETIESSSLRVAYDFYIESPTVVTVCVTIPSDVLTQADLLVGKTVRFMATDTVVDAGLLVGTTAYTIPNATSSPLYILGMTGQACPRNVSATYVGQLNMQDFTKFKYIIAVADSCGTCAGTGNSPYTASDAVYGSH